MFKSFMIVVFAMMSLGANAQFTLSGTVRNGKTGVTLEGATIQVVGAQKFTTSGADGSFTLTGLATGAAQLKITFIGFAEKIVEVNLTKSTFVDVALDEITQVAEEVVVMATRATEKSPTTFTTLDKPALQKQNFGQDLPMLLNWTPSVVTTSDAGAGIGYTGVRIRGSDATRINVTINGIPYNDSESQGTYWVDVPDVASSTQSTQIQRGVGTSTNGAGAFGGSINLQTNTRNDKAHADIINSYGSFNTHRHTLGFGTGLINNMFTLDGRASLIRSDGFIDRATSDLKSYYFAAGYYGKKSILKAIVFGGNEVTYQSWYGVPQSRLNNDTNAMLETAAAEGWNEEQANNLLNSNSRTFNSYTYKNQVDNYSQDHYQLHFSHRLNTSITANTALHYTYGRGYYEEFRYGDKYKNYGLPSVTVGAETFNASDLVRRRWLDNRFYGFTWSLNYDADKLNSILGGGGNKYDGDHFGEIIWSALPMAIAKDYRYYFNNGKKTDFTVFWKNTYAITDKLSVFMDLQYRRINYQTAGLENKQFNFSINQGYDFFNPKAGLTYVLSSEDHLYASYAIANREPVRDDFVDGSSSRTPTYETLNNLEIGWRKKNDLFTLNANYYLMDYINQLVLTGAVNDVGASVRTNVPDSYRTGIELDGTLQFNKRLRWNANFTVSRNKIKNFTEVLYDYGVKYDAYNEVKNVYADTDISFSPTVTAGSVITIFPTKGLELSFLTKYVGKQFLDNTSNDARKINPYFINDARASYSFQPKSFREVSFSILLNNMLDAQYSSNGYTWGYLAGSYEARQNYYFPQAGRNFLAMLTLKF